MKLKKTRWLVAPLMVLVLVSAGCGGAEEADTTGSEEVGAAATTSTTTTSTTSPEATAAEDKSVLLPTFDGETKTAVASAIGGIRFEYPAETAFLSLEDVVVVHPAGQNPNDRYASISLVSQLASGAPVTDTETYLNALEQTHSVEPTGTSVSAAGFELVGYDVSGPAGLQIFANSRYPAPMQAAGGPAAAAQVFVVETASGVVDVGIGGQNADDIEAMLPVLGTMLETLEFVGPGPDPALPPGEIIEPADAGPPPPPADGADDAPNPPLGAPFAPATPGRHELLNFGLAVSVDFDDNWFVQPNFPGVIVLTHPESVGPNDRDIVFINSIAEFVPIAGGPTRAGDPVDVSDIETFIDSPPDGVTVSDVERLELTAESGATTPVVSFTIAVDPDATCTATDPCEFAFVTTYGFVKPIRAVDQHRIWWFPEHPHGPAAAVAAGNELSDWLGEAEVLMESLELSR